MKLSHTLTLILCLHLPLAHSSPGIEDQKHRELALVGTAAITAVGLFIGAAQHNTNKQYYDHKIRRYGPTSKRIDKRDAACAKATVNLIASALLGISSIIYFCTVIDSDSLGDIPKLGT